MLLSVVIDLEAAHAGQLPAANGRLVHGWWFQHWRTTAPAVAERLHANTATQPFTLSPVMGLPYPHHGTITVEEGARAWVRVATLTPQLSTELGEHWLPHLPPTITLGEMHWRVAGATVDPQAHPWAGQAEAQALAERWLLGQRSPGETWTFELLTPTAFHGKKGHVILPYPYPLVGSWLRRWQAFGPVPLPETMSEVIRRSLSLVAFRIKSVPLRGRRRLLIGCVGTLTLRAEDLSPVERAALSLLADYAFWVGSGHHTTQGMGMTRWLPEAER
jgi:CRISPR-associated endoribonuclease Cas6